MAMAPDHDDQLVSINTLLQSHCDPTTYNNDTMCNRRKLSRSASYEDYIAACNQDLISEFQADIEGRLCYDYQLKRCEEWSKGNDFVPLQFTYWKPDPSSVPTQEELQEDRSLIAAVSKLVNGEWRQETNLYKRKSCLFYIDGALCVASQLQLPCQCPESSFSANHRCIICGAFPVLKIIRGLRIDHFAPDNPCDGDFGSVGNYLQRLKRIVAMKKSPPLVRHLARPSTDVFKLWQGPPGTGKTLHIVTRLDELHPHLKAQPTPPTEAEESRAKGQAHTVPTQRIRSTSTAPAAEHDGTKVSIVAAVTNQAVSVCLAMFLEHQGYSPPQPLKEETEQEFVSEPPPSAAELAGLAEPDDFEDAASSETRDGPSDAQADAKKVLPIINPLQSKILVIGSQYNPKLRAICKPFTLDAQALLDPEYVEADRAAKAVPSYEAWEQRKKAWKVAKMRVLKRTEVVFATFMEMTKLHSRELACVRHRVQAVFLDEAGLIPEWHTIILGGLFPPDTPVICIGDQQQLKPFSAFASWRGRQDLNGPEGFFLRLTRLLEFDRLRVQYRMHPDICDVVSEMSYDGELETHPSVLERCNGMPDEIKVIQGLTWIHHTQREQRPAGRDVGWSNPDEVSLILSLLLSLEKVGSILQSGRTICVITFYQGQTKLLQAMLSEYFPEYYDPENPTALLRLATVDSMQGDQSDVIILSMVRSNDHHGIGFVRDRCRMNVAISRAREALIIVGDMDTFSGHHITDAMTTAKKLPQRRTLEDVISKIDEAVARQTSDEVDDPDVEDEFPFM
eukprot:m.358777 g.358777  ORF g.358777 m.358777 type:complete len:791 (+) comp18286_c0_seq1:139-2511(+)